MKAVFSVLFIIGVSMGVSGQTPLLNSFPAAQATVFIDFDGHRVQGTPWNGLIGGAPIDAQPSAFSAAAITEIFNRVAEDYRIFNVNITTDSTIYWLAPLQQRVRIIVTPTYQWYPASAGGVAFVGMFSWADESPAWVFSDPLGNSIKKVAEAVSHEAGHSLGLQHQSTWKSDCTINQPYYKGQGTGEISWAPIMGEAYAKNITTWHNGTSALGCSSYQDDISIIAGYVGLRGDDHADAYSSATAITLNSIDFTASGIINTADDKDVFQFTINNPTTFRLNAIPENVGSGNSGADVDIRVSMLNSAGDTVGHYNPSDLLNAGVDSNINSGTYYLVVEGVGNINLGDYGSLGYFTLSGQLGNALPIHRLTLTGNINNSVHMLNWMFQADETIKVIETQYSTDGTHFIPLTQLPADSKTFSWKPVDNRIKYYRVRVITLADERSYYSNIVALREEGHTPVKVISNMIADMIMVNTDQDYTYQLLDETGRLLQHGKLSTGANRVEVRNAQKGLLLLRVQGKSASFTYKLIKQ
jgi:hypothetical protein